LKGWGLTTCGFGTDRHPYPWCLVEVCQTEEVAGASVRIDVKTSRIENRRFVFLVRAGGGVGVRNFLDRTCARV